MAVTRNLAGCVDEYGNIFVCVQIGREPDTDTRETGFNASPATVARSLRDLADDVETLAGKQVGQR